MAFDRIACLLADMLYCCFKLLSISAWVADNLKTRAHPLVLEGPFVSPELIEGAAVHRYFYKTDRDVCLQPCQHSVEERA